MISIIEDRSDAAPDALVYEFKVYPGRGNPPGVFGYVPPSDHASQLAATINRAMQWASPSTQPASAHQAHILIGGPLSSERGKVGSVHRVVIRHPQDCDKEVVGRWRTRGWLRRLGQECTHTERHKGFRLDVP
jgi:hypothetical protein